MIRSLLLVALAAVPLLSAQEVRVLKDVVYGRAGDVDLKLDAYLWEGDRLAPGIIHIHGGGWRNGDKGSVPEFLLKAAAERGVSVISIGYRLSGVATYPAQVEDVARAVKFIRHKAAEWHMRPDRIAVIGFSAGAHLSLWIGLHDDLADAYASDPVERESTRVTAIANYFGPTDFHLLKTVRHQHPAYRQLFGLPGDADPEKIGDKNMTAVSPISYVSSDDPPVFTYHGIADTTVPIEHARRLIGELEAAGVPNFNITVGAAGHGRNNIPGGVDVDRAATEFLFHHLFN